VSKNGNLLLNISPKADGTIPQEQKEVLLGMGNWLKKYGEAVYCTRAWEKYGEGPTKMGAAHGVFEQPKEGTSGDIRFTRSKDNTALYALLMGWDEGQKQVKITSLSASRIDLKKFKKVELINGLAGNYLPLHFNQDETGLTIQLPEKTMNELAYVLKLSFDGTIPALNNYAEINCTPYYYLSPDGKPSPVLGAAGVLSNDRKNREQQWRLEKVGNGIYKIINRKDESTLLAATENGIATEKADGTNKQLWKISHSFNGMLKIENLQFAKRALTMIDNNVVLSNRGEHLTGWQFLEVCETKQTAFKPNNIPGTIEVEDFDKGCPGDAWYDKDEQNSGGKYRPDQGMDIEVCAAGGYNIGWSNSGEWMAYTLNVDKTGKYKVLIYIATVADAGKLHLEFNGINKTGTIEVPNTGGYQNWQEVEATVNLEKGTHMMKLMIDNAPSGLNLDKMVFTTEK
jgi:alpha-L-fucosidase